MIKVVALLILISCTACTVVRVGHLNVMLLCKKEVLQREGMSVHFEKENTHHNRCNAKMPLQFIYNVGTL